MPLHCLLVLILTSIVLSNEQVNVQIPIGPPPMVRTKLGNIVGTHQYIHSRPVATYLGVPYAKAPIGSLRFRRPIPKKPWITTLDARRNKPACMTGKREPMPWADLEDGKSEDCLYLNIWTPLSSTKRKAVMFWLYGGGFYLGSNRLDVYDGRVLAGLGDVIVVTVNYRLGPFGFVYLDTPEAPGNAGLFDVVEALKWVNANIDAFGGNKDQITIFGTASGAIIAGLLGVSHLARPLFKRIIMESGSPSSIILSENPPFQNYNRSLTLAKKLKCANKDKFSFTERQRMALCLKGKDAMELAKADTEIKPTSVNIYTPQYGDEILPTDPQKSILAGDIKNCELLIGNNNDEGANIMTKGNFDYFGYHGEKASGINKTEGRKIIQKTFQNFKEAIDITNYYYADVEDDDFEGIAKKTYSVIGDVITLCPDIYFAEKMAEKSKVYFYLLTQRSSSSQYAKWMGVPHFDEVPYVFGRPLRKPLNYSLLDQALSSEMIKIWTSFAKTGQPKSEFGYWPLFSRYSHNYMILNACITCHNGYGPQEDKCNALRHVPVYGYN